MVSPDRSEVQTKEVQLPISLNDQDVQIELSFGDYFARIIRTDSKFQFIAFLKKQLDNPGVTVSDISKRELLKSICSHRAVKCATVLLQGDTGVSVDLNVVLEGGLTPLQLAARSLSSRLTELFLRHGAEANICSHDGSNDLAMLPLNLALNELCHHQFLSDWTLEKSIFKLFYIFCLPELKDALDTIQLLASKTKDIEKSSVYNVVEVIKVAAVVMVSWDRIIAPFVENGIEVSPIWQHVRKELGITSYEEAELLTTRDPNPEMLDYYKYKKANLLAELEVLKIPAAVYDLMEQFRHSDRAKDVLRHKFPFEIASDFFKEAALVLKLEDVRTNDIKCLRFEAPKKVKDRLNENLEKEIALGSTKSRPIKVCVWRPRVVYTEKDLGRSPNLNYYWLVKNTLARDNKDDFVKSIYTGQARGLVFPGSSGRACDILEWVYRLLCYNNAGKCAAAVLAGETAGVFDIRNYRDPPLHRAAEHCAPTVTAVLLNDGSFSANVRSSLDSGFFKDGLPLEIVLQKLKSYVTQYLDRQNLDGQESAIVILSYLCCPFRRGALETVRLLAKSTNQLKHLFLKYLNGGQMVEVAILLLVSRDELLSSRGDDFEFKSIADIHSYLVTNAYFSDGDLNPEMARLLKIFDRIGDKLDAYLRLHEKQIHNVFLEIASLVEDAGLHVKSEDIDRMFTVYSHPFRNFQLPVGGPNDDGIIRVPAEDLDENDASRVASYYETLAKKVAIFGGRSGVQPGFCTFSTQTARRRANSMPYPNMRKGASPMPCPNMRMYPNSRNRLLESGKGRVSLGWITSNASGHLWKGRLRHITSVLLSSHIGHKSFQFIRSILTRPDPSKSRVGTS